MITVSSSDDDMESQPATQPYTDPRRLGRNNSGLSEADLSDVLCILHPSSKAAIKIVSCLAKVAPEHILPNEDLLQAREDEDHALTEELSLMPRDIALRMSTPVKNLSLGFVFGRMPPKVDVLLTENENDKFLSQQHFRIYINSQESLMIQDMSTTGMWYDEHFLTNKRLPENPAGMRGEYGNQRMIVSGTSFRILPAKNEDDIRFHIRIPTRETYEDAYQATLDDYISRIQQDDYQRKHPEQVPQIVSP